MLTLFTGNQVRDRDSLVHQLVLDVARVLQSELSPSIAEMSAAERRGYVRTKAAHAARTLVRQLVRDQRLPAECETDIVSMVSERAAHSICCELQTRPVTAIPTPHVRRSAA
jgi:hypothetical protein